MIHLQISMFDSNFYRQQVRILYLDVKVENIQLRIYASSNLTLNDFYILPNKSEADTHGNPTGRQTPTERLKSPHLS